MKRSAYNVAVNRIAEEESDGKPFLGSVNFRYSDYMIHMYGYAFYFKIYGPDHYCDEICDERNEHIEDWNGMMDFVIPQTGKSCRQMLMELPEDAVYIFD